MEQVFIDVNPIMLVGLVVLTAYLIRRLRRQISLHLHQLESMVSPVTIENSRAIDVAETLIDESGIKGVAVSANPETIFDHYNSDTSSVNLTENTGNSDRLYKTFIASHEASHAIVDKSSRILKWIIDSSANVMLKALTVWLAVICLFWMIYDWPHLYWGIIFGIGVQLFATTIIQIVETVVNRMTHKLINNKFNLPDELKRHLRRCGRTALATHFCDVLIPLSCIFILLTGTNMLPMWTALVIPGVLVIAILVAYLYRRIVGNRLATGFVNFPF